jgi:PBP1b-binding outer membrane lipoprotein LpoB
MKHARIPALIFVAALGIVGCSNDGEAPDDNVTPAPAEPEEPVPAETPEENTDEGDEGAY